jgi:hypothetical protein
MRFGQHVETEPMATALLPMVGVALLLGIVGLLSVRGARPNDRPRTPQAVARAGQRRGRPIHVALRATAEGRLAAVVVDERPLASLDELPQELRRLVAARRGVDAAAECEVELAFDDQLQYQYLMDALLAISSCPASDGQPRAKLIEDIKFVAPGGAAGRR